MFGSYLRSAVLYAVLSFPLWAEPSPARAGANPFIGEIEIFAFNFCPTGWAALNGQLLPINQNQALFALLGTTYGGDGKTTFALPTAKPIFSATGAVLQQCIALQVLPVAELSLRDIKVGERRGDPPRVRLQRRLSRDPQRGEERLNKDGKLPILFTGNGTGEFGWG